MERRRSLLKDGNDAKAFRHHRDRHIGHAISNEYYQQAPFFFTRECSQLNLVGQYKGASAFLVLNGPSLVSGDYDLSLLNSPGVITYGVNNGPSTFRPTFWSCVDDPTRFLKSIWLDPRITKFVPHAHAEKPIFDGDKWEEMKEGGRKVLAGECPNCVFFHRNEKFVANRWLFEDKINWGNSKHHGGGRSVMLPALRILFLLGFRKVYLLGADFNMTEDYAYHFDEKRERGAVNCNMSTYKKLKTEFFPQLKPFFEEEGFEVYNCNPNSGLKVFPHVSFNDAIRDITAPLGNVSSERTWGMYCKPGDKEKTLTEPPKSRKSHMKSLSSRESVVSSLRIGNDLGEELGDENYEEENVELTTTVVEKKPYSVVSIDNSEKVSNRVVEVTKSSPTVAKSSPTERAALAPLTMEKVEVVSGDSSPKPESVGKKVASKLIKNLPIRR